MLILKSIHYTYIQSKNIKLKKPAIHEPAIKTVTPVINLILHSFVLSLERNYKDITQLPS